MQTVAFTESGRVEVIQVPRSTLLEPGDAIVLVTTARLVRGISTASSTPAVIMSSLAASLPGW